MEMDEREKLGVSRTEASSLIDALGLQASNQRFYANLAILAGWVAVKTTLGVGSDVVPVLSVLAVILTVAALEFGQEHYACIYEGRSNPFLKMLSNWCDAIANIASIGAIAFFIYDISS